MRAYISVLVLTKQITRREHYTTRLIHIVRMTLTLANLMSPLAVQFQFAHSNGLIFVSSPLSLGH